MTFIPDESKVVYKSKDTKEEKVFDALEWLVPRIGGILTSRTRGNPAGRDYYGYYSNVARGKHKKNDHDELIPSILEPDCSSKEYKRNWSRLIQKIYEVDPLTCPKCQGRSKIPSLAGMRILAFIEDEEVIKKILNHLGLWERKARPPPKTSAPQPNAHIDKTARPGATRLPIIGSDHVLF